MKNEDAMRAQAAEIAMALNALNRASHEVEATTEGLLGLAEVAEKQGARMVAAAKALRALAIAGDG